VVCCHCVVCCLCVVCCRCVVCFKELPIPPLREVQVVMGQLEQRISDFSHQRQLNEHRKQLVDVQVCERKEERCLIAASRSVIKS